MNELIQGVEGLKYTDWPREGERWRKCIMKKRKVGGQAGAHNTGQMEVITDGDRIISLPENSLVMLVEMLKLVWEEATCTTSEHSHPSDCQRTKKAQAGGNIFLCLYAASQSPAEFKSSCVPPYTQRVHVWARVLMRTRTHRGAAGIAELLKLSCICRSSQERTEIVVAPARTQK